jgi:hypothetical protein
MYYGVYQNKDQPISTNNMTNECSGMDNPFIRDLVAIYVSNVKPKSLVGDDLLTRNFDGMLRNLKEAFTSNAPPESGKASLVSVTRQTCFSVPGQHKECHTPMTSLCTDQATCKTSAMRYHLPPSPSHGLRRRIHGTCPEHSAQEM